MPGYPTLDALVKQVRDIRPLGLVATKVIQLTGNERFSAHEFATVISSDQVLTAQTLRLANSAYYRFPRRITTVRDAVVLLGFREVRAATLASCVIEAVPPSNHIAYDRFWHYSLSIGMLAEVLARAERQQPDEAFTAGGVHNIGQLRSTSTARSSSARHSRTPDNMGCRFLRPSAASSASPTRSSGDTGTSRRR